MSPSRQTLRAASVEGSAHRPHPGEARGAPCGLHAGRVLARVCAVSVWHVMWELHRPAGVGRAADKRARTIPEAGGRGPACLRVPSEAPPPA